MESLEAIAASTETYKDVVGGLATFLGTFIAAGVGVGGGPLYVPVLIYLFGNGALRMSKLNSCAVGFVSCVLNLHRKHPIAERRLINYDVALLLEPVTLLGSVTGVPLTLVLPSGDQRSLIMIGVLGVTFMATLRIALQQYKQETEDREALLQAEPMAGLADASPEGPRTTRRSSRRGSPLGMRRKASQNSGMARMNTVEFQRQASGGSNAPEDTRRGRSRSSRSIPSPNMPLLADAKQVDLDDDPEDGPGMGRRISRRQSRRGSNISSNRRPSPAPYSSGTDKMADMKDLRYDMFMAAEAVVQEERGLPWRQILLFLFMTCSCYILEVLSGGGWNLLCTGFDQVPVLIGMASAIIIVVGFTMIWAAHLLRQSQHWARCGLDDKMMYGDDLHWERGRLALWPLLALLAGLCAGATGISAGIVKAPLMLYMGMAPASSAATSSFMLLFTSTSEALAYYYIAGLDPRQDGTFFVCACFGALCGQLVFVRASKCTWRQSFVSFWLACVILLSCLGVATSAVLTLIVEFDKKSVCAHHRLLVNAG